MERRVAWGLLVLRVVLGAVFLAHGVQELLRYHFSGVAVLMARRGVPLPEIAAVAATLVQFLGGIALVLGLFTRWAALLLAIAMAVSLFALHLQHGFFMPGGVEYPLVLLAGAAALALAGPGAAALDHHVFPRGLFR